jgi:uncharacterized protein (TIGR02246 family)
MGDLRYADVVEGVRATLAEYAHALDDGRAEDVVATFCPDGVLVMGRGDDIVGADALRTAYEGWAPQRPQRHVVVNTHVAEWSDTDAVATSDLLFLLKGDAGWAVQMVGRYADTLCCIDGRWRFQRRVATFA